MQNLVAVLTLCARKFDLLTLKVVTESRVTWATSVPILVFIGISVLSVLDLGPMYATERRQTRIIATLGSGHNNTVFTARRYE